jgi:hypothetical protein
VWVLAIRITSLTHVRRPVFRRADISGKPLLLACASQYREENADFEPCIPKKKLY